ncbi:transglutaminase, partial [Mycobacterium tuberculosis]
WGAPPADPVDDDAAYRVLAGIADGLGLPISQVRPAYEDPLSRLAAAVRMPAGDPVESGDDLGCDTNPDTPTGRAALLARLDEAITSPAAYVLPLHRRDDGQGWASANWRLRRGRIVLLEGDSPAGLRLPLDSISWRPPRASFDADPVAVRSTLPAEPHTDRAVVEDPETAPTTALVAEVRGGLVHIFLPPTDALEHFIDLVARVEAAATTANCPVVIEGYGPP